MNKNKKKRIIIIIIIIINKNNNKIEASEKCYLQEAEKEIFLFFA